jgi:exodeoxyribonuclease III
MRIISYNTNGIRAAIKKGFIEWLNTNPADIVCVQESKAVKEDVDLTAIENMGYESFWFSAKKKGYSGVCVFTKIKPTQVFYGNGFSMSDDEGRVIRLDFDDITLLNCYYPSGTSGEERQTYKYQWLKEFSTYIEELKITRTKIIVCGDYNIAHTEIDIHDPKGNKKSSGFLPEERAWMDSFLASGFIDTFRYLNENIAHKYSWWSQRFPSVRLQNKGWRIDYMCVSEAMKANIKSVDIYDSIKHSDHCPIFLELTI